MIDDDDSHRQVAPAQTKKRVRLDMRNKITKPKHSHHVPRLADATEDPESTQNETVLIADGLKVFEWLASDSTHCLIGQEWIDFCHNNGFTRGYRKKLAELVRTELVSRCEETREEARARITIHAQNLYRDARLSGEYGAAVSALKLQKDILLPDEEKKQTVNVNLNQFVVRLPEKARTVEEWEAEAMKALPPPSNI